jgi:hypothetical protein
LVVGDGVLRKEIVGGTPFFFLGSCSADLPIFLKVFVSKVFFSSHGSLSSLETAEFEASDASAAIAADARAPNGSLMISVGVMYILSDGAITFEVFLRSNRSSFFSFCIPPSAPVFKESIADQ